MRYGRKMCNDLQTNINKYRRNEQLRRFSRILTIIAEKSILRFFARIIIIDLVMNLTFIRNCSLKILFTILSFSLICLYRILFSRWHSEYSEMR